MPNPLTPDAATPRFKVIRDANPSCRNRLKGWLMFGGAAIHEGGHWLAARSPLTKLTPVQLRLVIGPASEADLPKDRWTSGLGRFVAILHAHAGCVFYAGSTDPVTDVVFPGSPPARRFNETDPGRDEALSSVGGPLLQLLYGCALLFGAGTLILRLRAQPGVHWWFVGTLACFLLGSAGGANFVCAVENADPRIVGSDGWYVKQAWCRCRVGGARRATESRFSLDTRRDLHTPGSSIAASDRESREVRPLPSPRNSAR